VFFRNENRTPVKESVYLFGHRNMKLIDYVGEDGGAIYGSAPECLERQGAAGILPVDASTCLFGTMDLVLRHLRSSKMNLSSLHMLMILYPLENRRMKLNELALRMGLTCAGITKVADSLDQMGFTVRSVVPGDRRSMFMNLTKKGVAFAESIEESLVSCVREGFALGAGT
jgi:DNA-binding MarR family transcriptional regulator